MAGVLETITIGDRPSEPERGNGLVSGPAVV